jgi:hypothetical protein
LSENDFLDLIGASNVIPGPTSTEVAMYTERRRAGDDVAGADQVEKIVLGQPLPLFDDLPAHHGDVRRRPTEGT